MDSENYIQIEVYCEKTQTPLEFIEDLLEFDLVEVEQVENKKYIPSHVIVEIERMYRLRNDLGINMEGIDATNHLIQKISSLQSKVMQLRNRLKLYESF